MGKNRIETVAVILCVGMVIFGLSAGFAGFVIEDKKNHAEQLAEKTGTRLTKLTFNDGTETLAYRMQNGQYVNTESMINAYRGHTDKVIVYNAEDGQVINESTAPISFNGAAGLLYSTPGQLLSRLAVSANS